jgi:catechol 2,3-dioxygenase-like lactoylglutathione lyase family enzyme
VAASPHGDPVFRQAVTSVPVIPYTTSVDVNPRGARLDDTSSAAPVKLTVRPQRFAGPVRFWRPGWDTGSAGAGRIASQGTGASNWRVKMGSVLDHLSIQCADVTACAAFYDAVLPPLGGRRVMDFGEVIGFGVPPRPGFWIGPRTAGEGAARRISRSWHPAGLPCGHSSRAVVSVDAEVLHEPRVWPGYHPGYYGAFVRDPDGNNVEAVCRAAGWRPAARLSPPPAADDRAAPPGASGA